MILEYYLLCTYYFQALFTFIPNGGGKTAKPPGYKTLHI